MERCDKCCQETDSPVWFDTLALLMCDDCARGMGVCPACGGVVESDDDSMDTVGICEHCQEELKYLLLAVERIRRKMKEAS